MMKVHPSFSFVPLVGTLGASIMSWNSAVSIAKDQGAIHHKSSYGIGTSELNFMGAQDAFIAGSLFIAFAALARATYLYSNDQKRSARTYFTFAGAMLLAVGMYALLAGLHHLAIPGSKIGEFGQSAKENGTGFCVFYNIMLVMGAALVGTGYSMSTKNAVKHNINADGAQISNPSNTTNENRQSVDL